MVNDHSRYRIMESSEHAPGNCWVTGTAKGPFVDTGIYIPKERFGQLVLSKDFIEEAAHMLGLFADIEDKIERAYEAGYAEAAKEQLDGRVDDLLGRVDDLADALRNLRGGPVVDEPAAEDARGVGTGDPLLDSIVDRAAVEPAGQGDDDAGDEGPAGVPAGAGHVDPFRV